jgi:hypothetical protein
MKGGDGFDEPTSQLHTCWEVEANEKIRNFPEWGGGNFCGATRSGVVGLAAAVLIFAAAFFLYFLIVDFVAAVDLGSGLQD